MRGKQAPVRILPPDPIYKSPVVTKLINFVMKDGKKSIASKVVYDAMKLAAETLGEKDPLEVLNMAIGNIKPHVEIRSRRIGGGNYQVPIPVSERRGLTLAMRWLIQVCRSKKGKPMHEKLATEIVAAFKNEGEAVKKKEMVERMAEANKAFAQFRF